jgi:hypothetical protein
MPPARVFEIWRGNSLDQHFRFLVAGAPPAPADLTGDEIVFRIAWADGAIEKSTAVADSGLAFVDAAIGEVALFLTVAETRQVPRGRAAKWEIERRRAGAQTTLAFGEVIAGDWINTD